MRNGGNLTRSMVSYPILVYNVYLLILTVGYYACVAWVLSSYAAI